MDLTYRIADFVLAIIFILEICFAKSASADDCGHGMKMCFDKRCVEFWDNCPEEGCTLFQFSCHNGYQCIRDHRRCDGFPDCRDNSDEIDCYFEESHKGDGPRVWLYLLIAAPIIVILIVGCHLYEKAKKEQVRLANAVAERLNQMRTNENTPSQATTAPIENTYRFTVITRQRTESDNPNNGNNTNYRVPIYESNWSRQSDIPSPTTPSGDDERPYLETPPPAYESVASDGTTHGIPPPPSYEEATGR